MICLFGIEQIANFAGEGWYEFDFRGQAAETDEAGSILACSPSRNYAQLRRAHQSNRYVTMSRHQQKSVGQQEWPEATTAGSRVGGGRYLLKRVLGQGDYTQVWQARDVKAERDVALKFLPRGFPWERQLLERLDKEIRRSALLAHPGIARVYELVCDYQVAAIATEYVDGWPLAAVKGDRPGKRL